MANLNELTLDELAALGAQIATLITAGKALEAGRLGPVFDLTPGAPISIYTNAIMPAMDEGVSLTPLAADIVRRTSTRDLTHCGPDLSVRLRKEAVDYASILFPAATEAESPTVIDCAGITTAEVADRIGDRAFERDVGVDIPSFLKRESTEAPPTSPASEPVDPPPALGEVVGGGTDSAEPSRPAEAAPSVEAEAESGGGEEVPAPEAPAAPDAKPQPEPWSVAEDSTLIHTVVDLMVNRGMARKPAATEASKLLPGRTADACIYRAHTKAKEAINAAVAEAAVRQAQTEPPEIPPAEPVVASVSRDAATGGHPPAAVQEVTPAALNEAFDRRVDAMPDLHGDDLRVWQWIAAHRAKWPHTAGTDLDLAVGLGRGEKIGLIAVDLGIDVMALQARWDCISKPIRNGQDKITIDGMPRLINILRRIAKAPAAAA